MTNHVGILVTPATESGIAQMMQYLGGRYVRDINHIYRPTGTKWKGPYKANLVDSEAYLLICRRRIGMNQGWYG